MKRWMMWLIAFCRGSVKLLTAPARGIGARRLEGGGFR